MSRISVSRLTSAQVQVRKIGTANVYGYGAADVSSLITAAGISEEMGDVIIGVSLRQGRPVSFCTKGTYQWLLGSGGTYANAVFPAVGGYSQATSEALDVYYIKVLS